MIMGMYPWGWFLTFLTLLILGWVFLGGLEDVAAYDPRLGDEYRRMMLLYGWGFAWTGMWIWMTILPH